MTAARGRVRSVACCLVPLLGLASCGGLSRERRFTGTVTPAGTCGETSQGTLTVEDTSVEFTPTDGVIMLRGDVGADGAARARLATTGADRKPFVMTLTARISNDHVDGTYVTPRCTFSVSLDRVRHGMF